MSEFLGGIGEGSGLVCLYFSMLIVGVLYALVILVGGGAGEGAGDVDVSGHDFDLSGHDVAGADAADGSTELAHISPVTIAGFVTAFGAFGIVALSLFETSSGVSLIWATIGGVLVGLVSHVAFVYFFLKPQGSSEVTRRDVIGARAEVITPIPEDGVGAVAFVAQGARVTMTARDAEGGAIDRGTVVTIKDKVGSVALVRPISDDE